MQVTSEINRWGGTPNDITCERFGVEDFGFRKEIR